jgi:hypothetical protein
MKIGRAAGSVAAAVALMTGVAAAPAAATSDRDGELKISVADTIAYRTDSCAKYPYTLRVDVPAGQYWSVDVDVLAPGDGWGTFDFVSGTGPKTLTRYAQLCPYLDGIGTFRYEATLEFTEWTDTDGDGWDDELNDVQRHAVAKTVVKLPAKVSVNAAPEPVRKGRTITVTGKVTYRNADWATKPVRNQYVTVQRKAKGSSTWTYVGKDRTDSNGTYVVRTTARSDASYRAVYPGTSKVAKVVTSADYVDVR